MKRYLYNFFIMFISLTLTQFMIINNIFAEESSLDDDDDHTVQFYSREDFPDEETLKEFAESHPENMTDDSLDASNGPNKVVKVQSNQYVAATSKLKIIGALPGIPVQKVYIGSTYAYALQYNYKKGADDTSYIVRCKINGSTATKIDMMTLKHFGHVQSLEWFSHNGKPYFWTTCKATSVASASYAFGIQVARIYYEKDKVINDYTDVVRLSSVDRATGDGTSFGPTKRVEIALSSNYQDLFLMVEKDISGSDRLLYAYYDSEKLNNMLDSKESSSSKYLPINQAVSALKGYKTKESTSVLPFGSNQGLEFTDAQSIYVIGGSSKRQDIGFSKEFKTSGPNASRIVNYGNQMNRYVSKAIGPEPEGLQLKGDQVYFNVYNKDLSDTNGKNVVYSIPKSSF